MVLALVLGNSAENAFRQAMLMSNGSASIFYANGIVSTIMSLAIFMFFLPFLTWGYDKLKSGRGPSSTAAADV